MLVADVDMEGEMNATETVTLAEVYKALVGIDTSLVIILTLLAVWFNVWLWRTKK